MNTTNNFYIGLMSGTSLDGLDIVAARFQYDNQQYHFIIEAAETVDFDVRLRKKLKECTQLSGLDLTQLDHELADFFADSVLNFKEKQNITTSDITLIASHGHTVFHQPRKGITLQIGNGAKLAARTNCDVICDFRIEDVAQGGQGAPLVPVGDDFLFSEYDACINLGGFCNISLKQNEQRIAYDIAPCNLPLNFLSRLLEQEYDKNGKIARSGVVDQQLLDQLNALSYYRQPAPKSLGVEWLREVFYPLFPSGNTADTLRTVTEHTAQKIAAVLNSHNCHNSLFTGGGCYNKFLIERIRAHTACTLNIPNARLVDYKEALIFAFLGYLKNHGKNNVYASVTGGAKDGSYGIFYPAHK